MIKVILIIAAIVVSSVQQLRHPVVLATKKAAGKIERVATLGKHPVINAATADVLTVAITPAQISGPPTVTAKLTGTATSSTGAAVTSWTWTYGDGIWCTGIPTNQNFCGLSVTHFFTKLGTYHVTLSVTDATGVTGMASATVTVAVLPPDTLTATLSIASGNNQAQGLPVVLNLAASSSGGTITAETWDCNNGIAPQQAISLSVTCSYPAGGTFNPSVIVTDSLGKTATATVSVTVIADSVTVSINAVNFNDQLFGFPVSIAYTATSSGGVFAAITTDCGNGITVIQNLSFSVLPTASPNMPYNVSLATNTSGPFAIAGISSATSAYVCNYATAGTFTSTLTVVDSIGMTATTSTPVIVAGCPTNPALNPVNNVYTLPSWIPDLSFTGPADIQYGGTQTLRTVAIKTNSIPGGFVGQGYCYWFNAGGGKPPYTFSATNLPPGLTMASSGLLSGIFTTVGTYMPQFKVTDSTPVALLLSPKTITVGAPQ